MRFRLDENLDIRLTRIISAAGHEVLTVYDEDLTAASDARLAKACKQEKRCLLTLDKHFANPIAYPPKLFYGIIVLRPRRAVLSVIQQMVSEILHRINHQPIEHALWIVEPGRIRIYPAEND